MRNPQNKNIIACSKEGETKKIKRDIEDVKLNRRRNASFVDSFSTGSIGREEWYEEAWGWGDEQLTSEAKKLQ